MRDAATESLPGRDESSLPSEKSHASFTVFPGSSLCCAVGW